MKPFLMILAIVILLPCLCDAQSAANPYYRTQYGGVSNTTSAWDSIGVGAIYVKDVSILYMSGTDTMYIALENDTTDTQNIVKLTSDAGVYTIQGQPIRWIRTKSTSGTIVKSIASYQNQNAKLAK